MNFFITNVNKCLLGNCCDTRGMKHLKMCGIEKKKSTSGWRLTTMSFLKWLTKLSVIHSKLQADSGSSFFNQYFPACLGLIVSAPKLLLFHIYLHISIHCRATANPDWAIQYYSKKPRLKLIQLSASNLYHVQYLWASRYRLFPVAAKAQIQFWRPCQQSFNFLQLKRGAPAGRAFTATVWRIAPRLCAGVRNPAPVSQGRLRTCHSQHCNQIGAKKLTVWTRKASVVRLSPPLLSQFPPAGQTGKSCLHLKWDKQAVMSCREPSVLNFTLSEGVFFYCCYGCNLTQ